MSSFYNDNEPFVVEWLNNLTGNGVIDDGIVDGRSVSEVAAADLLGYRQCHFFAGIGGWPEAFRIAGLTGVNRVWSASLPCQPVSSAGKRKGSKDKRHLWPEFYPIVSECRPSAIFGEQSASPDGRQWIDGISLDLEELGYAVAAADLCAAGVGAPHKRQRIYWVAWMADTGSSEFSRWCQSSGQHGRAFHAADSGIVGRMGHTESRNEQRAESSGASGAEGIQAGRSGAGLDNAMCTGLEGFAGDEHRENQKRRDGQEQNGSATETGPWDDFTIAACGDGKTRRVGTGVSPLANGIPRSVRHLQSGIQRMARSARRNRKGRIGGYGNAVVPPLAAAFILSAREAVAKTFDPK